MRTRIQSVEDLKKVAARKLESEFNEHYAKAILDGAMQGVAFVMYTLEMSQGWKVKRQQKLFEDMISLMDVFDTADWLEPFNAADVKRHIEDEYGIDFSQLLERVDAKIK